MIDCTSKILLGLIAAGLWANFAASFLQAAIAQADYSSYLIGIYSEVQSIAKIARGTCTNSKAIQKGRLSAAARTAEGEFRVEPSELHRVFSESKRTTAKLGDATAAQIAGLEQMLAFAREQLEKAERDGDAWRAQAEAAQKLLIDARPKRFSWWR
jgi:hypothetical protein